MLRRHVDFRRERPVTNIIILLNPTTLNLLLPLPCGCVAQGDRHLRPHLGVVLDKAHVGLQGGAGCQAADALQQEWGDLHTGHEGEGGHSRNGVIYGP